MKQNQTDERDTVLRDALRAALPDAPASPELRARVAQMATQSEEEVSTPKRGTKTRRARLAWSAVGVACALLALAVAMPRVLTTQAMAQIEAAMADVKSAHLVTYEIKNGKRIVNGETWYQNGKWRVEYPQDGRTSISSGGQTWTYEAVANTVTKTNSAAPFARKPTGFALANWTQDLTGNGEKPDITLLGDATYRGVQVKRVQLVVRNSMETTTLILWVDKASDLPLRGDITSRNRYGQQMRGEIEATYNEPVAPALFEPNFKRDARFVDKGRQQSDILGRLNAGIARQKVGERTIAIRDLRVNARGDVFVLYTAGKTPKDRFSDRENWFNGRDWKIYLTDSLGTRYHYQRGSYEPEYIEGIWPPRPLYNGERLQGDWWVPEVAPQLGKRWQPRTFTLEFEVNPRNLHGGDSARWPADYSAKARFKIPVDEAQTTLVPTPTKFIGGGLDDEQILRIESEARGELPPGTLPSPELQTILIEGEDTYDLKFSPAGQQILTGGDGGARLFEAQSGRLLKQWRGPQSSHADKIVVSPDGESVGAAFTTRDYRALDFALWDAQTRQERARWKWNLGAEESLASLEIAPDNRTLRVVIRRTTKSHVDPDPRIGKIIDEMEIETQQRDLLTGKIRARRVLTNEGFTLEIEQAQSGGKWWIATLQNLRNPRGRVLTRYDGATGEPKFAEDVSALDGRGLAMAAGRVAVSGQIHPRRADGSVDFEAPTEGSQVRTFAVDADKGLRDFPHTGSNFGSSIALSDNGRFIAFEDAGHTISVRDVSSGRTLQTLTGHYSGISHLAFSPDGTRLVSSDLKGKTFAWKLD